MQAKLEEVLEQKEKELKLHRKFQDLKLFCEESVYPGLAVPLRDHIERLKDLVEKIIPDPRDRKEEMFSAEIFVLLGALYLHDMGLVRSPSGVGTDELFNVLDRPHKTVLATNEIGARLGIPSQATEIINYLSLSDLLQKFPMKWEIEEDGRKGLIRNAKVLQYIFNFSHLLLDVFQGELRHGSLRRYGNLGLGLCPRKVGLNIDSREGIIEITYREASPYEMHVLKGVRSFVDGAFHTFKTSVNGRLGLQYRRIKWDITGGTGDSGAAPDFRFSRYDDDARPRLPRWEEAASILDRLLEAGSVLVAGEESVGKTTILTSFVSPQLGCMVPNTFYCELWERPVREIRDVICKRYENFGYSGLDIVSICNRLLERGPCAFILDSCERMADLDDREREKFERFLKFCLERDSVYLIVCGEKETFFDWFRIFDRFGMSSIREIRPVDGEKVRVHYGDKPTGWIREDYYRPIECELVRTGVRIEEIVEGILKETGDVEELRGMIACLTNGGRHGLGRYTMENIRIETGLPVGRIVEYLYVLKRADLVTETFLADTRYFSLSNRWLMEPLRRILKVHEFRDRERLRACLRDGLLADVLVDRRTLDLARKWKERMLFSKEETGLLLASILSEDGGDCDPFVEKANLDGTGIDVQPLLRFVYSPSVDKRKKAIELIVQAQDKRMINPLLRHLKKETVQEIRDILIKGMGRTGRKGTMIAVVQTLREIGDGALRLKAIEFFCSLLEENAKGLLTDILEKEEDPVVLTAVKGLLAKLET